jgi:hypothetical protein
MVVVDGVEGKEYHDIGAPIFSPDSQHIAYAADEGGPGWKDRVVVDGVEGKEYDGAPSESITFSPDSKRVAYIARLGDKHVAVVDGIEGKEYENIAPFLAFSPNSRHVVYEAARGGPYWAGIEGKVWVVIDGNEGKEYDWCSGMVFDAPDKLRMLTIRNNEIFRVEIEVTE